MSKNDFLRLRDYCIWLPLATGCAIHATYNSLLTHVVHVAELDAPEYLEDVAARLFDAQPLGILLELLQDGVVDVLEDQEQLPPPPKHLDQIDEVLMAQSLNVERK